MNAHEFARGRITIPKPLDGDAYTVAGQALAADQPKETATYALAFRTSPKDAPELRGFARDDRMVFFGLSDYVRNNLTRPLTPDDVDKAEAFMATAHAFGGALPFERVLWDRVVGEYNGFLPIRIDALPEGSTFYPGEPVVQVTSLDHGFGEIAALVEAHLVGMVSVASARATMERHLLERFKEYAAEDNPAGTPEQILFSAQLMVHDFGMRASSASEESEVLGKAHLLSFLGTDTFNAAYQAFAQNGGQRVGSSILALAHRIVQGADSERAAFDNIRKAAGPGGIGSYVADCYDFHAAIDEHLLPMAREAAATDKAMLVARPDSGDYLENVMYIVTKAAEAGLYTTQPNGRKAMTNLRFIQGDSMNWEKMSRVMDELKAHGYSPVNCGIFGVGGWLRNTPNRDTLSVAYKLTAKGKEQIPVVKLSDTRAKMSAPGPNYVIRGQGPAQPSVVMQYERVPEGRNVAVAFYDGSATGDERFKAPCLEAFSTLQQRTIREFDAAPASRRVWSDEVMRIQDATFAAHGRERNDYRV